MKKHTTLKAKFNSAFSLVELLVVIAVIAVIAAIAIPNITGTREAAEAAKEAYNADQIRSIVQKAQNIGATNVADGSAPDITDPAGTVYRAILNITNGTNVTTITNDYTWQ